MRINSIHLQNFRQFKNERIEFTNIDKKVTIVHGKIHIGKTTLVKALLWCLYSDADNFRDDPVLVNRELETGYVAPNTKISVSVAIELEHNGFDYRIQTSQTFQYMRGDTEGKFVAMSKDPIRRIVRVGKTDSSQLVLSGDDADKEIDSILPFNLKNYFFYDGENNKIDEIAQKSNLQEAVRNIMNLQIREEFIRYFSPTTKGRLHDRFSSHRQTDDSVRAADLQADIEELLDDNETDEEENDRLKKEAGKLRAEVAQLEAQIEANADAEELQRKINEARKQLEQLRRSRDDSFRRLVGLVGSSSGLKKSGFGSIFAAIAFTRGDLANQYANLKLTERSYGHQSADSIDEIIRKGICICGLPIHEGDEHYNHLIDQKNYVNPRDYSADLHNFLEVFQGIADAAGIASENIYETATQLKDIVNSINRWEETLHKLSTQLGDFKDDVGQWKRDADAKRSSAVRLEERIHYSEEEIIPNRNRKIQEKRDQLEKLASRSAINEKIDEYLAYVDYVLGMAQQRLALKKEGVAVELQKEVNSLYHAIIGSNVTELRLNPITYNVDSYQDGKRIKLSTGQQTARNLAFVGGLIYLAKHKDQIGGASNDELDAPEDYPLILDAPFSNLNEDDVVRVCTELPKYCGQLIITALEKDYKNAIGALKPYLDRSYSLVTNETSTDSRFKEDVL